MKQTAVEWLIDKYIIVGGITQTMVEQAKEMEKEQIIDAFEYAWYEWAEMTPNVAEQYYNETFNQNNMKQTAVNWLFENWKNSCNSLEDMIGLFEYYVSEDTNMGGYEIVSVFKLMWWIIQGRIKPKENSTIYYIRRIETINGNII